MESLINFVRALWDFLTNVFAWLVDVLLWVPRQIFAGTLDGAVALFSAIPVPSYFASVDSLFSQIPGSVWWFGSVAQFDVGVPMVMAALALRFLIRRLPFVG